MPFYTLETCPSCEGSGFNFCPLCEGACEHDQPCAKCGGEELVPVRIDGWEAVAAAFVGSGRYPEFRTAAAARNWLAETPRTLR